MKQYNFLYLTRPNGAGFVQRDLGFMMGPFKPPLPRLFIVNGETGHAITDSGYTCVRARPDACMDEWVQGRQGFFWWDYPKAWLS